MNRKLTLALVQMHPALGEIKSNLKHILELTERASAAGAEFVIFPELALTGYNQDLLGEKLVSLALSPESQEIQELARAARRFNIYLCVGFIEKRTIPGVLYNAIIIFDPQGKMLRTYAKSHLFSAEHLHFRPGADLRVLPIEKGMVGPMICMDIGYPEVARILSLQGAELLIAPSAWIREDEDIWPLHLQARALDNLVYVAGINRVGVEGKLQFIGRSMLVDPRGKIIQALDDHEDMLVAEIDLDLVAQARRGALHWTGRRPELYQSIADLKAN